MSALDSLNHLLNFFAPALGLALLLPLSARLVWREKLPKFTIGTQMAVLFLLSAATLSLGLWYFGDDGKMATYIGMVLLAASAMWLMQRGWRAY